MNKPNTETPPRHMAALLTTRGALASIARDITAAAQGTPVECLTAEEARALGHLAAVLRRAAESLRDLAETHKENQK